MKEKGVAIPGIKVRNNAIVKKDPKEPDLFLTKTSASRICDASFSDDVGSPTLNGRVVHGTRISLLQLLHEVAR